MANIRPLRAVRYARRNESGNGLDISSLIAPPFDVLDAPAKAALQARHPNNIVTIDVPHIPPKAAGPAEKYDQARITFDSWLDSGILIEDSRAAFYPYMQSFEHHGRMYHRKGFYALVRLSPFGQGQVVPHEKTYKGAIEDRLALMRAMHTQMSPIFGLYSDDRNEISSLLYQNLGKPELSGSLEGVKQDLWTVGHTDVQNRVIDLMGTKPIYIADGHHRYTTALAFQKEAEERHGGPLPPNHPANWCLFVLVSLHDDGLLILPTHRIIGGLSNFNVKAFKDSLFDNFEVAEMEVGPSRIAEYVDAVLPAKPPHTIGMYVGELQKLYELRPRKHDLLKGLEPNQSEAWRNLDVAILQRYLLDEVLQPTFGGGRDLLKSYTADAHQIVPMTNGSTNQLAFLLQSTPLHALEELGKHNEVMPQKSTYFYPKLATGLVINRIEG